MKARIILLATVMLCTLSSNSQTIFSKGDIVGNAGIGLGHYLGGGFKTAFIPTSLSLEFGVKDDLFDENSSLGVGGYVGYHALNHDATERRYNLFVFGGRANAHYQFIEKLDTYFGVQLGYRLSVNNYYGSGVKPEALSLGGFDWATYVGARYFFLEKLAGFAEVGYGISPVTIGLALKL